MYIKTVDTSSSPEHAVYLPAVAVHAVEERHLGHEAHRLALALLPVPDALDANTGAEARRLRGQHAALARSEPAHADASVTDHQLNRQQYARIG